jgi:tetratricopeptide (TPR) repeat protein
LIWMFVGAALLVHAASPEETTVHWRETVQQCRDLYDRGDYQGSVRAGLDELSLLHQVPSDPERLAISLNDLGMAYFSLGNMAEAEQQFRHAIAIRTKMANQDPVALAVALTNLGVLLTEVGHLDEAEAIQRRALRVNEKAQGALDPGNGVILTNLGNVLSWQGKLPEAERTFAKGLSLLMGSTEAYPITVHRRIATANNLAGQMNIMRMKGSYEDAERLAFEALGIYEDNGKARHPEAARLRGQLGAIYFSQKQYAKAERIFKQTLEDLESTLGENHPSVGQIYMYLAGCRQKEGDIEAAKHLYLKAIQIGEASIGRHHMEVLRWIELYAQLLQKTRERSEAKELLKEVRVARAELWQNDGSRNRIDVRDLH